MVGTRGGDLRPAPRPPPRSRRLRCDPRASPPCSARPCRWPGRWSTSRPRCFAEGCTTPGAAKCTYGTGIFLLANIGAAHVPSTSGLATSIAWAMRDGTRASCVDGQVYSAGAAVAWLQRAGPDRRTRGPRRPRRRGQRHRRRALRPLVRRARRPALGSGRDGQHHRPGAVDPPRAHRAGLPRGARRRGDGARPRGRVRRGPPAVRPPGRRRTHAVGRPHAAAGRQPGCARRGVPALVRHRARARRSRTAGARRPGAERAIIDGWQPRRVFEPAP